MLGLLVGYWSGFVVVLVWICSMPVACNASRTTCEQTQHQYHDKSKLQYSTFLLFSYAACIGFVRRSQGLLGKLLA